MSTQPYRIRVNNTLHNQLHYICIQIDSVYKSTLNLALLQFNQTYLLHRLVYELCEINIPCCVYDSNIYCLIYNSNNKNIDNTILYIQQYINQHSNKDTSTNWHHTVTLPDHSSDIPTVVLYHSIHTYIDHVLAQQLQLIKYDSTTYIQIYIDSTQTYVANAAMMSVTIDHSNNRHVPKKNTHVQLNCSIELKHYRIKPVTNYTIQDAQQYSTTDEPTSIHVLPHGTEMYIVPSTQTNQSIAANDITQYWLYRYNIQLPDPINTVTVQYNMDSAALQYPLCCVLDSITKTNTHKPIDTTNSFINHIIDCISNLKICDIINKHSVKLLILTKLTRSNDNNKRTISKSSSNLFCSARSL